MVFLSLGKDGKACGQKMVVGSSSGEEGKGCKVAKESSELGKLVNTVKLMF